MLILGINGGVRPGYQDVSAVLLRDGEVIAAIEEERLTRIVHSPGVLPYHSILYVLDQAGVDIREIDFVASHGQTWGDEYQLTLEQYFKNYFSHCPPIRRVHHHDAHIASSYYASGMDEALVVSFDSSGDGVSTQISRGKGGKLDKIKRYERPQSLGIFYSLFTQYCGFKRDSDEYKLMGLSSYGQRGSVDLDWALSWREDSYHFNNDLIVPIAPGRPQPSRQQMIYSQELVKRLSSVTAPRVPGSGISPEIKNLAASVQGQLEQVVVAMVRHHLRETGLKKLCLAGGVALNCVLNQKLLALDEVEQFFIQPAAGDAGVSLGAAYLVSAQEGVTPKPISNVFWGREYSSEQIREALENYSIPFKEIDDPAKEAARRVCGGEVVAWFQGGSEFGPRALGHRSILGDPTQANIQQRVNQKIKFRESFRPFCPSVSEDEASRYYGDQARHSPYMTVTFDANRFAADTIAGVTHVDQTARIQTVNENIDPLFYRYLSHMKQNNGHGVSLNTSFNRSNEPIAETPRDALSIFYGSGLDSLIMGNYIISKKDRP